MAKISDENYSDAEAAKRRDAITKALIATPPQKHKPLKVAARTKKAKKRKA